MPIRVVQAQAQAERAPPVRSSALENMTAIELLERLANSLASDSLPIGMREVPQKLEHMVGILGMEPWVLASQVGFPSLATLMPQHCQGSYSCQHCQHSRGEDVSQREGYF
jgi:hypothetical protein